MPKPAPEPRSSEITSERLYVRRREFIKDGAKIAGTAALVGSGLLWLVGGAPPPDTPEQPPISETGQSVPPAGPTPEPVANGPYDTDEPPTPYQSITTYNNFYEFGLDKRDPSVNAHTLMPRPWTISIEGEVAKPQTIDIDTLLGWFTLEDRIYRMRCVEAWSMVIPWQGFPLAELIKRVEPTGNAKYVEFVTL